MSELLCHTIDDVGDATQFQSARKSGSGIRATRLALALSVALLPPLTFPALAGASVERSNPNDPQGEPLTVVNCNDSGAGSLRDIISNVAQSGDTVNLAALPLVCGTISLSTGEIVIAQDDLTLQGPDPGDASVTISGGGASRVLDHQGFGTLVLDSLTVTEGYNHASMDVAGGCLYSRNSLHLNRTIVSNCTAVSDMGIVEGGGIFARGDVNLILSTISGNRVVVVTPQLLGVGGGIYAGRNLITKYSSISTNAIDGDFAVGGGAFVDDTIMVSASTVDNNKAADSSAIFGVQGTMYISSSTISANVATVGGRAIYSSGDSMTISNSTIAFNHSASTGSGSVAFSGSANSLLTLQSSIIANNTAGAANAPEDLYIVSGHGLLSGADNLVIASNVADPTVITVSTDPKLGPLQFNGGTTRTHALLPGSPALDKGNNNAMRANDQRGDGYPRTTGPTVDIGALQFDTIFSDDFDFD